MNGITVTLDLDKLVVGSRYTDDPDDPHAEPVTLVEAVSEEVARLVLQSIKKDATSDAYGELRKRATAIRDEEIRAAIKPAVEQVVTATLQATDPYGNTKGEAKTAHELIVEQATKLLTTPERDHYSRDKGLSPVQKFIRDEVHAAFGKELQAVLDTAKADVLRAVREQGAKVLSETIAKMAGVRV